MDLNYITRHQAEVEEGDGMRMGENTRVYSRMVIFIRVKDLARVKAGMSKEDATAKASELLGGPNTWGAYCTGVLGVAEESIKARVFSRNVDNLQWKMFTKIKTIEVEHLDGELVEVPNLNLFELTNPGAVDEVKETIRLRNGWALKAKAVEVGCPNCEWLARNGHIDMEFRVESGHIVILAGVDYPAVACNDGHLYGELPHAGKHLVVKYRCEMCHTEFDVAEREIRGFVDEVSDRRGERDRACPKHQEENKARIKALFEKMKLRDEEERLAKENTISVIAGRDGHPIGRNLDGKICLFRGKVPTIGTKVVMTRFEDREKCIMVFDWK